MKLSSTKLEIEKGAAAATGNKLVPCVKALDGGGGRPAYSMMQLYHFMSLRFGSCYFSVFFHQAMNRGISLHFFLGI